MKWWDRMPWSSFSERWALSQLFHSPLSLLSRGSFVLLHLMQECACIHVYKENVSIYLCWQYLGVELLNHRVYIYSTLVNAINKWSNVIVEVLTPISSVYLSFLCWLFCVVVSDCACVRVVVWWLSKSMVTFWGFLYWIFLLNFIILSYFCWLWI